MRELINLIIAGLDRGANFALIALGLTLVFGTLGVVNFAHGALFMLGALVLLGTFRFFTSKVIDDPSGAMQTSFLGEAEPVKISLGEYLFGAETAAFLASNVLIVAVFVLLIFMALVMYPALSTT